MDPITQQIIMGAAGAGGGSGDATYVDDVFSTFLYDGTGNSNTITNEIDLDGEGGLVWIKRRDGTNSNVLYDTERGTNAYLSTNMDSAEYTASSQQLTAFNSDGFTVGTESWINGSGNEFVSWSFRKAPGFFDIVTYTGNGSNRAIAHNLGSKPGFIIIKSRDSSSYWRTYNQARGATKSIVLNATFEENDYDLIFNDTEPTSTHFTVGTEDSVNKNGDNFVAYLFAHDDQSFGTDGDEAIIKCGEYTETSSGVEVDLGFEPQWVLTKLYDDAGNNLSAGWRIFDSMRGMIVGSGDRFLEANTNGSEGNGAIIDPTSTGFIAGPAWGNGTKHVYVAIRRPNKPPEDGTDVFKAVTYSGSSSAQTITGVGFAPDYMWSKDRSQANNGWHHDRLRGVNSLDSSGSGAEQNRSSYVDVLGQDGIKFVSGNFDLNRNNSNHVAHFFKRAPGFFDTVAFVGNTPSSQNVSHNLGVVPEMMILKNRQSNFDWNVYHASLGNNKALILNDNSTGHSSTSAWNTTTPTASVFSVGDSAYTNQGSQKYIAYLFASLDGISKVGSYTGTGSNINVDCGFTAGARYVLIKRTDSTGNWYVYDSVRGIVSGNDPYLFLNTTGSESTPGDYIDPLNSGFTVTSSADFNVSGGTYIFLAIA